MLFDTPYKKENSKIFRGGLIKKWGCGFKVLWEVKNIGRNLMIKLLI